MEDNARLMPTQGHHTAPKWDEEKVREETWMSVKEYEGEFTPAATPNGLSCHLHQPDNPDPDNSDNEIYEDWVDQMYGFMHLIQPLPPFIHLSAPKNVLLPALIPYIPAPKPMTFQFTSARILATEEAENNDSEKEPEQS
ncbi:hypothetical protein C0995_003959, partial [Termitomyces sp. Mi166